MAVNGEAMIGQRLDEGRLVTQSPTTIVSTASVYRSLPSQTHDTHSTLSYQDRDVHDLGSRRLRQFNVPHYAGSSSSSTVSSGSSEDAMNMRFTELTHMHLKKSIESHGQHYNGVDVDYLDRQVYSRHVSSSSSNGTIGSGGAFSAREGIYTPYSGELSHRQPLPSARMNGSTSIASKLPPASTTNASSKFQSLLSVKDALLEEKETTIVKLRLEVSSLQHQVKESNGTLRQILQSQQTNVTRSLNSLSLEDHSLNGDADTGYETAKMRVRLAQQEKNVDDLEGLLGKTECDLVEAKSAFARERKILEEKVKELELCLRGRDKSIMECKKKQKALTDKIKDYKKRVESLEKYLSCLPTMEESRDIKRKMDSLARDKDKLSGDLEDIREKYEDATKRLSEREECLKVESEKNSLLEEEIEKLSDRITELEKLHQQLGTTERQEYEDTKAELETLHSAREDAAKLLSASETRNKALTTKHKDEIAKLEERIEQEENATQTLKRELNVKQQASTKVQSAMMKLASQNQQLMEEKMSFLEQLRTLENESSMARDSARMTTRLIAETQTAVRDLEAVTEVLLQTSKGDDPNLSALLGVRPSSVGLSDEDSSDADVGRVLSAEEAKKKLNDVRKLRRDINELRSMVSNRYAENIGKDCATQ